MGTDKLISLKQAQPGERFQIKQLNIEGTMRRRLLDLGFIPGAIIEVGHKSPLGDPVAYYVSGTTIALREEESSQILGICMGDEPHE